MSFNLLDAVKGQLTSTLVEKAAGFVGESSSSTSSALTSIVPSLIGVLAGKADEPSGISSIMSLLGNKDLTSSLGNLGSLFGGDTASIGLGSSLLSGLLGDKLGGLTGLISKASGVSEGSSKTLLSMAAPLVLGLIGKEVASKGLGLSGLKDMLLGQKDSVKGLLPAGFDSSLGFSASNVGGAAEAAVAQSKGGLGKLLPILLLVGLGILAFFLLKDCKGGEAEPVVTEVEEVVEEPVVEAPAKKVESFKDQTAEVAEAEPAVAEVVEEVATVTFNDTKKYGFFFDGASIAPVDGATVTEQLVDGVNVKVFTAPDNTVTKVFKKDDGTEVVQIIEASGKVSFLQRLKNGFKSITSAFAFKGTALSPSSLKAVSGGSIKDKIKDAAGDVKAPIKKVGKDSRIGK